MKKFILFFVILINTVFSISGYAQNVAINANGNPAATTAILDISSNSKGILVPRMSSSDRNLIINPAQGLLVYDMDTRNFWFYDGVWNQINSGGGSLPIGPASGDLTGSYPSPNVAKIQNLDVAFGVPFDHQVLKWDILSNNWKGRNDSLFLPYSVTYGDAGKLFGIQNNNTSSGASAICGKSGSTGSGITPANSMGVWGDNSNGLGVVGTSNIGIGTYGLSFQNHGVYGYSTADLYAGVCGSNSANAGIGVLGEISSSGYGIFGKSTGPNGTAALFTNGNASNTATAVYVLHNGIGSDLWLNNTSAATSPTLKIDNNGTGQNVQINSLNANSGASALYLSVSGGGHGLYSNLFSTSATGAAVYGYTAGFGQAVYAQSQKGICGEFKNINTTNTNIALKSSTLSRGMAGSFTKNNTTGSISDIHDPCVLIDNTSKGNALKITSLHAPSTNSGVDINYDGQSYGLNVYSTHDGIHASSQSATGAAMIAENYAGGNALKCYNNASSVAAVQAENSHLFGIGIKAMVTGAHAVGISGNANSDGYGVEGINSGGGGCGLYGMTEASYGYALRAETSSTSWGVAAHILSNCPDAPSNTLWVSDNSVGQTVRIQVDNPANSNDALTIYSEGTGKMVAFYKSFQERFSIANNGNVLTQGSVTVKGNKGIVRSSTTTQLRMETVTSPTVSSTGLGVGGSINVTITFSAAFSSPPSVSVANINSGFLGACDALCTAVKDVTTTGCTLKVFNAYMANSGVFSGTWKLNIIGAE